MSDDKNWPAYRSDGQSVDVTEVSSTLQIAQDAREVQCSDVMIDNPGPHDVFVKAGNAGVSATELSVRVPAFSMQPFRKGECAYLALKCRAGLVQTVTVFVGDGV